MASGQVLITRDDQGNYCIDSDTEGFITEQQETAIIQVRSILQRQGNRIPEFRAHPERFAVRRISLLPS